MDWPASHIDLWAQYLGKEPSPDDRLEIQLAALQALYLNSHKREGDPAKRIDEFLLFRNAWGDAPQPESSLSDLLTEFGHHNKAR